MALNTKAVLLAALMGSVVPTAAVWAQTTPATPDTAATGTPTADTPATGADATPSTDAVTPSTDTPSTDAATPSTDAAPASTDTSSTDTPSTATPSTDATPAAPGAAAAPAGAPAAPAAGASPNANGLAAPAASAAEAQVGGFYVDSAQGDWQIRCQKTEAGQDPCELYQLLRDQQGNPVAEASLIPLTGKAAAGVTLVAPLETDLLPGLGFRVDTGKQVAYPFSFCAPIGCFSRVAMNQAEIDTMRRGSAATVTLVPYGAPQGTKVDLALSLKGFTAGWDAVKAKSPATPAETGPAPTAAPAAPATPAPATPAN